MTDYLPEVYQQFSDRFPAVKEAFDALGAAEHEAGPLGFGCATCCVRIVEYASISRNFFGDQVQEEKGRGGILEGMMRRPPEVPS